LPSSVYSVFGLGRDDRVRNAPTFLPFCARAQKKGKRGNGLLLRPVLPVAPLGAEDDSGSGDEPTRVATRPEDGRPEYGPDPRSLTPPTGHPVHRPGSRRPALVARIADPNAALTGQGSGNVHHRERSDPAMRLPAGGRGTGWRRWLASPRSGERGECR
jgi:hypothetical protein